MPLHPMTLFCSGTPVRGACAVRPQPSLSLRELAQLLDGSPSLSEVYTQADLTLLQQRLEARIARLEQACLNAATALARAEAEGQLLALLRQLPTQRRAGRFEYAPLLAQRIVAFLRVRRRERALADDTGVVES